MLLHHAVVPLGTFLVALVATAPLEAASLFGEGVHLRSCPRDLAVGEPSSCQVAERGPGTRWVLTQAPLGMVVQERSGHLHWTPTPDQVGQHTVRLSRLVDGRSYDWKTTYTVSDAAVSDAAVLGGLHVRHGGDDAGSGTLDQPLATIGEAVDRALPGQTIYIRGGTYRNEGFGTPFEGRSASHTRITTSGALGAPITMRPWGNEYVRIESDVNGLALRNAAHWVIEDLELRGTADSLELQDALALWWENGPPARRITGRGVSMNASTNITLRGLLVHEFPGAGVSNNNGADVRLIDSIVTGNAEWSYSGTHGFANSKPESLDSGTRVEMRGNIVFGNQSSLISHVFSKGVVTMEVDEGNGLHMQNNAASYAGTWIARDNVMAFNGKAGLGLNTVLDAEITDNAFYRNAQAVTGSAELSLQSSERLVVERNLFHPASERLSVKFMGTDPAVLGANASVHADADVEGGLPASVIDLPAVFTDPAAGDFSPAAGVPHGYGVDPGVLERMQADLAEYGLNVAPADTVVDEDYVHRMRLVIFAAWPAPLAGDGIPDDLLLKVKESGHCYSYGERLLYPAVPEQGRDC